MQRPIVRQAWITAEDINTILEQAGCAGEVDLLSIDIDGNDFWVWKAISIIRPRLVVVETHNVVPSDQSITIPYRPDFNYLVLPEEQRDFRGASLRAMAKLAATKGYRLIGAHSRGFNAFFLRNDEGAALLPEVSVEAAHDNPYTKLRQRLGWPLVQHLPWQNV